MPDIALEALEIFVSAETASTGLPKYKQLFDAFTEGIQSGRFKPGERVPAETELTRRLPVSLGTVQKAMAKLAATGLVIRNRKTGTFIAPRRTQVNEVFVYRFRDPRSGRLMLPFVRVLKVGVDESTGPWYDALKVKRCVRIDRLVWCEQELPAFSSVFFAYEHGKAFLNIPIDEIQGASSHRVLIESFNLPTLRMEHRFCCRDLSEIACNYLQLSPGTHGIVWDIKDFSFDDKPSLFQRFQLPPGHRPVEIMESFSS